VTPFVAAAARQEREERAVSRQSQGLAQAGLGDGYYKFNWKSPKSYANSCKTLKLDLGQGRARSTPPSSSSSRPVLSFIHGGAGGRPLVHRAGVRPQPDRMR
ncbi:MAG: hypothetical protein ACREYC_26385, partial [Gammaproteobacteria bacterium]